MKDLRLLTKIVKAGYNYLCDALKVKQKNNENYSSVSHREVKMIQYQYNIKKALEAVLFLISKAGNIDKYQLVKTMYFADEYHLNKYFRPVLGDNYVAMDYGPVGSGVKDILDKEDLAIEELKEEMPFEQIGLNYSTPKRPPNLRKLSKSDVEALEYGWNFVKDKSFDELKEITHNKIAYKNARENSTSNAPLMNYVDMLNEANKAKSEEIFTCAEHMVL